MPRPWNFLYNFDDNQYRNCSPLEAGQRPPSWNLSNWHPEAWVCNFLRTTGEEKRDERWLEHYKGKRHSQGERAGKRYLKKDVRVGTLSVFDAMARMRKFVNYREAEAIIEGTNYPPHIEEFDQELTHILNATLFVLEATLAKRIGKTAIDTLYADFANAVEARIEGRSNCGYLKMRRTRVAALPFL